jgi:hypothetical protein
MLVVPGLFIATGLLLLVLRPSDGILPMIGCSSGWWRSFCLGF